MITLVVFQLSAMAMTKSPLYQKGEREDFRVTLADRIGPKMMISKGNLMKFVYGR